MTPPAFLTARPFAHRGLHDRSAGRVENSLAAFQAAIDGGYGIEMDVQPSADGVAMVFHDDDLGRLTAEQGPIRARTAVGLQAIQLSDGGEGIPSLHTVLDLVRGRVPLLIEIKDQDGDMGTRVGMLEEVVSHAIAQYQGDVALMSFNPHSVAALAQLAPDRPRGIVTSDYTAQDWPELTQATRDLLRPIPDFDRVNACFISHEARALSDPRVAQIRAQGAAILCWTIRSPEQESMARKFADNITFEGYSAA